VRTAWPMSRDLLLNFGVLSISLEWVIRDFTFGVWIDRQAYKPMCKCRSQGAWPKSCDLLS